MKKLLLILAAVLACTLAFAQSLEGTWTGIEKMDDASSDADYDATAITSYTLKGESYTANLRMDVDISAEKEGKSLTMKITVTGSNSGTWTCVGDNLSFTPGKGSKPKIDVKVKGIPSAFASMFVAPIKKELSKALKDPEQYKIISLTDKELVLEDILTAKEIKAGEKAERVTLTKK